ncbi:MAG: hypothetical protein COA79_08555 [Planctomycetota bacterium]|nr:MAG: hypothetical protein COA79_08555 [Planctomycetota bacterium]
MTPPIPLFDEMDKPAELDTRTSLLYATAEEIYEHGYQAASLTAIIKRAGVTKGALYHHFESKLELGYALVDEILVKMVDGELEKIWNLHESPLECIKSMILSQENFSFKELNHGCPVFSLAQEMSPLDKGFKERFAKIFKDKFKRFSKEFKEGQKNGFIRKDINCDDIAVLFVGSFQGLLGLSLNFDDPSIIQSGFKGLLGYLELLKP